MTTARFIVGTLDTAVGWETQSVETAISRHITYWFAARENQGKVVSAVPNWHTLFMEYSHQPEKMVEQTKTAFKAYLNELFNDVEVYVESQNLTDQRYNYKLVLAARVTVNGERYDIAQTILATGELYKVLDMERLKK